MQHLPSRVDCAEMMTVESGSRDRPWTGVNEVWLVDGKAGRAVNGGENDHKINCSIQFSLTDCNCWKKNIFISILDWTT